MLEGELESAICRTFPILLDDLWAEGYRIASQQAILLGRRLDLLLRAPDGRVCIVELKAGAPPMPHVRDQIRDYAECWTLSYPTQPRPRLLVIGNSIPTATGFELANFGIESRAITLDQVLSALQLCQGDAAVTTGLKLIPDDLAKVRHLLSDHDAVALPEGLTLLPPWDHRKVFLALVKRGEKHKDLWKKNLYVQLYPQRPNCAVLYGPAVESAQNGPLHLNPRATSWDADVFRRMESHIDYVQTDNKGSGKERGCFDHYRVRDWDQLAASLGL